MGVSSSVSLQRVGCCLLAFFLFQCLCVSLTFLYLNQELKQIQKAYSQSSVACLMGDGLVSGPGDALEVLDSVNAPRREDACWQFKTQIQKLTEQILSNRYEQDMSMAVKGEISRFLDYPTQTHTDVRPSSPKVAAHVTGDYKGEFEPTGGRTVRELHGQKIKTWESQRGLAFLYSVEYEAGELIIPRTGLYYIYGQTYFRYREAESDDDSQSGDSYRTSRNKQMVQYIYKKINYPVPILLMKNARTTCWAKDSEYGLYSIYQGGVFELKYRDRIFVTVSNASLIDMDGESSYFGAFLIS
ncbi:tumor necrosis factor ligand superfamily member 10 [Callorhinchus milii]|uniref:Tumor necrosis factor ligand superfamily member 10 n=1 Tax=Callorhinchus milii TaxID=7868 RepID=A0A4W3JFM3_CALMI|nr:TNF superfamily member 10 [Callorhinchus milii]|eukprot:gi/632985009/ref/XP_007909441.1/ PREDICTED: tumor necrosis factor ligand superfamily member 10 [Callorhinchus milii]